MHRLLQELQVCGDLAQLDHVFDQRRAGPGDLAQYPLEPRILFECRGVAEQPFHDGSVQAQRLVGGGE